MTKRVLIIDDDWIHLATTRMLLEDEGWGVDVHASPFGSTERVMTIRPDVVLLDVNMPALSGESLLTILKGREPTKDTPVVLYSANDEEALQEAARRLGAAGYVCKGDLPALHRTLARVTRAAAPPAP